MSVHAHKEALQMTAERAVTDFGRDFLAGLMVSVVLIGNIFSFAALMFPGELAIGIPIAIWAMLIGSCVGGCWIAWATTIPPLATGIELAHWCGSGGVKLGGRVTSSRGRG